MVIHRLHRSQHLNVAPEQAWRFFSSPQHLNAITPDFFHVDIASPVPEEIYPGLLIAYRMRAVFGWPMAWLSEVCYCEPPRRFVYQQRVGPFAFFSHEVVVTPCRSGVEVEDIVFYSMRWGWMGELLHYCLIGMRLQRIFQWRAEVLQARWPLPAVTVSED